MRKEQPAAQARGLRNQSKTRKGDPGEVMRSERKPRQRQERSASVKYHRPRDRPRGSADVEGATCRRSATSAPPEHQPRKARALSGKRTIPRPSLKKDSWAKHQRFRRSAVEHYRPDASDRERCEGERQCGEDIDRRSVVKAAIAREPEEPGLREAAVRAALDAEYRSGERE